MKNLIFLSKAFVTMLTLLSGGLSVFAHDFEVNGIYYNYLDKTAKTVSVTYRGYYYYSYSNEYTGAVTIPSSVTYSGTTYSVTKIGYDAFYDCSGLTSVTIPNSVTEISGYAFSGCKGLTSITIPNSVTSIGSGAFYNCSGLTNLIIEDGRNSLYLGKRNDSGLGLFYDCPLKSAYLGRNIFPSDGLGGPFNLINNVTIGNSVTEIYRDTFCGCSGLTTVSIGNSVISIGYSAFSGCTSLTSITIPNSVTSIGEAAFEGCSGLTSVTIPNSVTKIGLYAFMYCGGLTEVNISDLSAWCKIDFKDVLANPLFYAHKLKLNGTEITELVNPDDISEINNYAFCGCTGLTSVTIPNSVTSIGESAFYNCTSLTSVTIPNSVTSIGDYAFWGCSGLTEVTIPNSVTLIGSSAFYNCERLAEVNISDLSAWCKITFGDIDANPLWYAGHLYLNGTEIKDLVIPDEITQVKDYAFGGCSGLTEVTIPNSVTTIGMDAFNGCSGLTSVTIPNSVTTIGSYAFYGCTGLTSVTIPNSVTSIGNEAFRGCSGLTTVSIGNSATEIGDYAFRDCSGLKEIVSLNPEPPICNDDICFLNVPTDCILKVPAGAKEAYSAAVGWSQFTNIIEIATVEVSTQGDNATFEIPTAVDAVKYTVKVYSDAEMTQLIATANYDADGKIMPMSTSLELSIDGFADGTYYYSVSALSENGVELENHTGEFVINVATGIGNASIENKTTEVARYDIYGRLLSKPTKGVNIVKMSDGTTKKLIIKN